MQLLVTAVKEGYILHEKDPAFWLMTRPRASNLHIKGKCFWLIQAIRKRFRLRGHDVLISADQLDNFFWLHVGKLLQPTSWIMQLFPKIWYCKFCSQGGATRMINFQSQFIQMRGDGKFVSVIVVIVLQCYIFWTETA